MEVESVRLKKTLKTASKLWVKGSVVNAPFHPELMEEINYQCEHNPFYGTIEILSYNRKLSVVESPTTTTTSIKTSNFTKKPRVLVARGPKTRTGPRLRTMVAR